MKENKPDISGSKKGKDVLRKKKVVKSKDEPKLEIRDYIETRIFNEKKEMVYDLEKEFKSHKKEINVNINSRFSKQYMIVITILGALGFTSFFGIRWYINKVASDIKEKISNRLDDEFKTEKIQNLIENKAKKYTEKAAKGYISKKVQEAIIPFQNKMKIMVEKTDEDAQELNEILNIFVLSDNAQNSRKAYTKLNNIAELQTKYSNIAKYKLIEIRKNLDFYRQSPVMYQDLAYGDKKLPVKQLSLDEIILIMENPTVTDKNRRVCMIYIKNKPKKEVLQKALGVLKKSDSLPTCAAFCGILNEIADTKAEFLDFKGWIKICEKELQVKRGSVRKLRRPYKSSFTVRQGCGGSARQNEKRLLAFHLAP